MKLLQVTFPRSGSQYLADSLKEVLGSEFKWVEGHETPFEDWGKDSSMIKYHDFNLDLEPSKFPFDGYIVQIRNPFDAISSWFDIQVENYGQTDSREEWFSFALDKFVFWKKFVRKWCLNHNPVLVIVAEDFFAFPKDYVAVVSFFLTGKVPEIKTLPSIRKASNYFSFRYYDVRDFAFFEALCFAELNLLGYKLHESSQSK